MYNGFKACYKLAAITGEVPQLMHDFEALYEKFTGMKPTMEAIEKIPDKIKKLSDKFKGIFDEEPIEFDFSEYLVTLEMILAPIEIPNAASVPASPVTAELFTLNKEFVPFAIPNSKV